MMETELRQVTKQNNENIEFIKKLQQEKMLFFSQKEQINKYALLCRDRSKEFSAQIQIKDK